MKGGEVALTSAACGWLFAHVVHRIGFGRVSLAAGASAVVRFNVTAEKLSSVDRFGTRHVLPGRHVLVYTRGHGDELHGSVDVGLSGGGPVVKGVGLGAGAAGHGGRLVLSSMVGLFDQSAADLGLSPHTDEF
jgi:hypothetical protein